MKKDENTIGDVIAKMRDAPKIEINDTYRQTYLWRKLTANERANVVKSRVVQICGVPFDNWTDATKVMFEKLVQYLGQSKKRWLLLIGGVGVGKTTLIKAMVQCHNAMTMQQQCKFQILNASTLADYYRRDSVEDICRIRKCGKVFIDDIGIESDSVNVYGNTIYPLTDLILNKYDDTRSVLILTTNLNSTEISSRYGERVLDRLVERCFVITNFSNSLRH